MYKTYDLSHRQPRNDADLEHLRVSRELPSVDPSLKASPSTSAHEPQSSSTASSYDPYASLDSSSRTGTDDANEVRQHSRDSLVSVPSSFSNSIPSTLDNPWANAEQRQQSQSQKNPAASTRPVSPPPRSRQRPKTQVPSACANCKQQHLSCDNARPCPRCVAAGRQATCVGVEPKKRGRPKLSGPAAAASAQSRASKRKKSQQPQPGAEGTFINQTSEQSMSQYGSQQPIGYPPASYEHGQRQLSTIDNRHLGHTSTITSQPSEQSSPVSHDTRAGGLYTAFPLKPVSTGASASQSSAEGPYNRPSRTASYSAESRTYQLSSLAASLPPTEAGMPSTRYHNQYQHRPTGAPEPSHYQQPSPYYHYTSPRPIPQTEYGSNRLPPPTDDASYNPGMTLSTLQPGVRPGPDSYHERLRPAAPRPPPQLPYEPVASPSNDRQVSRHGMSSRSRDDQESRDSRSSRAQGESRGDGHGSRYDTDHRRGPEGRGGNPRRIWE